VFKLAPIICGSSVWNLLNVKRLMPGDGVEILGKLYTPELVFSKNEVTASQTLLPEVSTLN
jgi:hypothetical protein